MAASPACLPNVSPKLHRAGAPSPSTALGLGLRLPLHKFALKSAFYNAGSSFSSPKSALLQASPRTQMAVAVKGAYICRDCGYIYNERRPFEKLSDDYSCPVCAAPKRRFKPYNSAVVKNANQADVRKARKEQLKQDSTVGNALPVGIVVGLAVLVGTYLYLNSQF